MKQLHPIRNDAEYAAALAEIERLWDAKPGMPGADRLDLLAILVDVYEEAHHPILPPAPVEAIRFRTEQLGRDRKDLPRS